MSKPTDPYNNYFAELPARHAKSKQFYEWYCQPDNNTKLKPDVHERLFSLGYQVDACCWRHEFILIVPKKLSVVDMHLIAARTQIPVKHLKQQVDPDTKPPSQIKEEQHVGWYEG